MINCFYGKYAQIRSFLTDLFTFIKENFNGETHFCTMSTNGINIMQEKCLHVFTGKFIVPEVRVAETRSVMSGESLHRMISVRIRNFCGPCFLTFGLSTEIYGVSEYWHFSRSAALTFIRVFGAWSHYLNVYIKSKNL